MYEHGAFFSTPNTFIVTWQYECIIYLFFICEAYVIQHCNSHPIFKLHEHLSHRWNTMKTMAGSLCLALALKQLLLNRSGIRSSILNASHFHTQQCVVVFALAVAFVIYILIFLFQFIYLFFFVVFCLSLMSFITFILFFVMHMFLIKWLLLIDYAMRATKLHCL